MNEDKPRLRKVGSIINQLMARRGYAQIAASEQIQNIVRQAAGPPLADSIEVGQQKAGVLFLYATDSVTLQELNFQKRRMLRKIQKEMPAANVTDLRFRIQAPGKSSSA
ncbi:MULTISPECIES: DUF721 domain-containing protein [Crateriforma]|uniref:DUF721 domain-containing protein n=1 Tax=Crateriforma conspicua TaxID=2527996 RepID=A0A5C6FMK8_9PLAN|nr:MULTISPECIES: DUF721 domain-containing protein [Crateriforma]TWU61069.1 hypothetical protein V7x_53810 [Crateriforma conspicua]